MLATAVAAAIAISPGPAPQWAAPLSGPLQVSRAFASPPVRWAAGHRGVDLSAAAGSTVRAAGAGRISYAGLLAGRGVVVVVHGELRTTYEPVAVSVPVGAHVAAGDPIGVLRPGHDPARPGTGVLHWGLLRGRTYLDPMSLLSSARQVRLLPQWGSGDPRSAVRGVSGTAAGRSAVPATGRTGRRSGSPAGTTVLAVGAAAAAALATAGRRPP